MRKNYLLLFLSFLTFGFHLNAQNSVPHIWTEVNLEAVRRDFAKPTVHARNLYHLSIVMYDSWAAYDTIAEPKLLGKTFGTYVCPFNPVPPAGDIEAARKEAISFAAYRLMRNRYLGSPGQANTFMTLDSTMAFLGYNPSFTSVDYSTGIPAALGNYIGQQMIAAGYADGANQQNNYANQYYQPVNEDIFMVLDSVGNPNISDMNRWQPISVPLFYDQSCEPFPYTPPFLGPEWGNVVGFALDDSIKTVKTRDGHDWLLYHDPGPPPLHSMEGDGETSQYQTGFEMVAIWSGHLDADDGVMWDISPASRGNFDHNLWPEGHDDYLDYYDLFNGGSINNGHPLNPATGLPYEPKIVPRGDYTRILAEFWADGPSSETPPGHWFSIYNQTSQHPLFTWKWQGQGEPLDHMEYDVKSYLTLGGAVHDCAVSTWGAKGFYDYLRPVSAIRAMSDLGQASDPELPNYHPGGMRLYPGHIELVMPGDPLAGVSDENVGKIKLKCWLGPIIDDSTDPCIEGANYVPITLGVGWKLAENWWPYQRPSFVSPNFAGYVSGHSTFSRAAAEVMTSITGDEFFPGGMGVFETPQNDFLVFEEGPSVEMELEWATYRDAADQCSLSRIWGGIHPPQDDIRGRKMGYQIGMDAIVHANTLFVGGRPRVVDFVSSESSISDSEAGSTLTLSFTFDEDMDSAISPTLSFSPSNPTLSTLTLASAQWVDIRTFEVSYLMNDADEDLGSVSISMIGAKNTVGGLMEPFNVNDALTIDTENPSVDVIIFNEVSATEANLTMSFSETMDIGLTPVISFPAENPLSEVLTLGVGTWISGTTFVQSYSVNVNTQIYDVDVEVSSANDALGNLLLPAQSIDLFTLDNRAPLITSLVTDETILNRASIGSEALTLTFVYDETMDTGVLPVVTFPIENGLAAGLVLNSGMSEWNSSSSYTAVFDLTDQNAELAFIDVAISQAVDLSGNMQTMESSVDLFSVDTKAPLAMMTDLSATTLTDASIGMDGLIVEVSFNEAMETSVLPNITFPAENGGIALSLASTAWTDGMTLEFSFDVVDAQVDLADIDLSISGFRDAAMNLGAPLILSNALDVLMKNPEVLISLVSESIIADSQTGNVLTISALFDENMDESVLPTLVFTGTSPEGSLDLIETVWSSSQEVSFDFLISDAEVTLSDIGYEIDGALDLDGNSLSLTSFDSDLFIDTKNPSVIAAIPSTALINNSLIGVNQFSIEISFDEPMSNAAPAISFPIEDPSLNLIQNNGTSGWLDDSTYEFRFDVLSGVNVLSNIDIQILNGTDTVGNALNIFDLVDFFNIDMVNGLVETEEEAFLLYPNPVQGETVYLSPYRSDLLDGTLSLYDMSGKVVLLQRLVLTPGEVTEISVQGLAPGLYQMTLDSENNRFRTKLIITD